MTIPIDENAAAAVAKELGRMNDIREIQAICETAELCQKIGGSTFWDKRIELALLAYNRIMKISRHPAP